MIFIIYDKLIYDKLIIYNLIKNDQYDIWI
jgi:hypothetical protein